MSTYKINMLWGVTDDLNRITEVISRGGDPSWPGLESADQIISITWAEPLHGYVVAWKVREWDGGGEP